MKMNVAYLRVSTEAQTEKYGLDLQKQKILDYCTAHSLTIDKWYIDGGFSGSKLDRPKMQELLDDVEHGIIQTVYIYKLDRMSRDVIDTLDLLYRTLPHYNVNVVSMTEDIKTASPIDRVMITVNAAMNQYEREVIRMRMSDGMVERVKKGYWMGGGRIPYGYRYDRNDGILHINPEEAEIVKQIFSLYISGKSTRAISRMFGWGDFDIIIRQIVKRKTYTGKIVYKGVEYQGKHEAIIDEETYQLAQECLKKRSNKAFVRRGYMLTGMIYCGVCGARMRVHNWNDTYKIICYSQLTSKSYMRKSDHCDNDRVSMFDVEKEVESAFKQFRISLNEKSEQVVDVKAAIEHSISKKQAHLKKLYKLYAQSESDELLEVVQEEEAALQDLKKQLANQTDVQRKIQVDKIDKINRVADVWDMLSVEEKNKILKEVVEKVVIDHDKVDIRFSSLL